MQLLDEFLTSGTDTCACRCIQTIVCEHVESYEYLWSAKAWPSTTALSYRVLKLVMVTNERYV
jgi:hypothetical protein